MALDVKYHDTTIGSLSQDGTIVATIAGSYCDDDLTVECADAIFTPMPPDESYQLATGETWNTTYMTDIRVSALFSDSPYLRFRIRNIPNTLDVNKYTFTANIVGDATHEDFVRQSYVQSSTEVRCEFGCKFAFQISEKYIVNTYYDGTLVGEYYFSYGGYIRSAWSIADAANKKFLRAFWAYGLAAKENF